MDDRILRFIGRHRVLSLGVEGWCAAVFYAFDDERGVFVYASDMATEHARAALGNPVVSASIVLETRVVGKLQGVQLRGRTWPAGEGDGWARVLYLRRFPFAVTADPTLWVLEPEYIKFTDNTLGFGRKLIWSAQQ